MPPNVAAGMPFSMNPGAREFKSSWHGGHCGTKGHSGGRGTPPPPPPVPGTSQPSVFDVWSGSEERAVAEMVSCVQAGCNFVGLDTEFPGEIQASSAGPLCDWETVKQNVNQLKLIQLGLTFCDANGRVARTFQVNFNFSRDRDPYNDDAIQLLSKAGIDFAQLAAHGVDPARFGQVLRQSRLLGNRGINWLCFHPTYDFAYLLRMVTGRVEGTEWDFLKELLCLFPTVFDTKEMACSWPLHFTGGLSALAARLNAGHAGPAHQAGSDSVVTCRTFFKLAAVYRENSIDLREYCGKLFGIGKERVDLAPTWEGKWDDGHRGLYYGYRDSDEFAHYGYAEEGWMEQYAEGYDEYAAYYSHAHHHHSHHHHQHHAHHHHHPHHSRRWQLA
eukprot:TRINITY_DN4538_c1_g4_i2.p1 TRINITY_DN4538_c1_g4~~TRINITY_DN4538_c1_g4_i2.p1  ORF type:complete len:414 (+),score=73.48 TRINITY_DN4538_c1_g4_i2:79-1242(+)